MYRIVNHIAVALLATASLSNTFLSASQAPGEEVQNIRNHYLNTNGTVKPAIENLMRLTGYAKDGPVTLDDAVIWTQINWRNAGAPPISDKEIATKSNRVIFDKHLEKLPFAGKYVSLPRTVQDDHSYTVVLVHGDIYPMATQRIVALQELAKRVHISDLIFATNNSEVHQQIVQRTPEALYRAILTHLKPEAQLDNFVKPKTKDEVFELVWQTLGVAKDLRPDIRVHKVDIEHLSAFLNRHHTLMPKQVLVVSSKYNYVGDAATVQKAVHDSKAASFRLAGGSSASPSPEAIAIFNKYGASRPVTDQDQRQFELNALAGNLWKLQRILNT